MRSDIIYILIYGYISDTLKKTFAICMYIDTCIYMYVYVLTCVYGETEKDRIRESYVTIIRYNVFDIAVLISYIHYIRLRVSLINQVYIFLLLYRKIN